MVIHHLLYGVRVAVEEGLQRDLSDPPRRAGIASQREAAVTGLQKGEAEEEGRTSSAGSRHLQRSGGPSCHPDLPSAAWVSVGGSTHSPGLDLYLEDLPLERWSL